MIMENNRIQFASEKAPVSFHFSGSSLEQWQENPLEQSTAVLNYAYVVLPSIFGMDFSLGRIRTDTGESLDGLYSNTRLTKSTKFSFFTGKAIDSTKSLLGGRFSHGFGSRLRIDVSYANESTGARTFREETGIDLRLQPFTKVVLSGQSRVDLLTGTWTQHSYSVKMGPVHRAVMSFDASLLDLTADPSDQSLKVSAGLRYPLSPRLAVRLDTGKAENYSAGITSSRGITFTGSFPAWSSGVSIEQREGEHMNVVEMSANVTGKSGAFETFVNLKKILRDRINSGSRNSASTKLGFAYDLSPVYRLVADLEGSRDAHSQLDLRSFIKLERRFGA